MKPPLDRIDWDEGLIQRLTELHARGYSSREIAMKMGSEFGLRFTRNSIIGKTNRLCLPHRVLPITQPKPKSIQKRAKRRRPVPRKTAPKIKAPRANPDGLLTIYQLGAGDCRFPFGHRSPFMFCGKQQAEGSSYCVGHFLLTRGTVRKEERSPVQMKAWA